MVCDRLPDHDYDERGDRTILDPDYTFERMIRAGEVVKACYDSITGKARRTRQLFRSSESAPQEAVLELSCSLSRLATRVCGIPAGPGAIAVVGSFVNPHPDAAGDADEGEYSASYVQVPAPVCL